ncbi:MAG: 3-alpha,7-alpha,12-alpha-trihydroxy-5-beta-cholest-24-enoyl-CoA hydratase [Deltaproteobacteria bacterium]|nr:3-alpha,7-alpha,12-alpha-trihydroxy-5-beta-cholest-24-enoyl-CoA hydratase [Deltaproteobacteria bacterium]
MGLNFKNVGTPLGPTSYTYIQNDVILYALGIGAGVKEELDFVYEKHLKVFPTFCVVPPSVEVSGWHQLVNINMRQLVQLAHEIKLFALIPSSGTVYTTTVYHPIYDRGDSGALIHMTGETRDENGRLLFVNRCTLLDRSAGNFGGDPGPLERKLSPPDGRRPDFQVVYPTSTNQAAIYRLSGDKNPMHIDPDFAPLGGFSRPILHGLCTFGLAGRAILHQICQSNPERLRSFSARFAGVVFPGETLVTLGWRIGFNTYVVQTKTEDDRLVLDNGVVEIA